MIRILTRSSNSGKHIIKMPVCWEEVTTQQYQTMIADWDKKDRIKLFSILSGRDYAGVVKSKDHRLESTLVNTTAFVYDQPMDFKKLPLPGFFKIKGRTVKIPKDPGSLSIGQNIHIRQAMEGKGDLKELISLSVAIYLQPLYDEKDFDYDRALELEKEILLMPIVKTYPVGFFFLRKQNSFGRKLWHAWHLMKKVLTSRGRQSLGWQRLKSSTSSAT